MIFYTAICAETSQSAYYDFIIILIAEQNLNFARNSFAINVSEWRINMNNFKFRLILLMVLCPIFNVVSLFIQFAFNTKHTIPCIMFCVIGIIYISIMSTIKGDESVRINKALLIYSTVIKYIFLTGATFEHTFEGARAYVGYGIVGYFLNYTIPTLLFLIEMIAFYKKPNSKTIKYFVIASFLCIFLTLTQGVESFWVGFMAIPFMTLYITFDNTKLVIIVAIITNIINLVGVYRQLDLDDRAADPLMRGVYVMETCFIILFTLAIVYSTILIKKINQNKLDVIESEKNKIKKLSNKMIDIGIKVKYNSSKTMDLVSDLNKSTNNTLLALQEIKSGNTTNINSVEEQYEMSVNITNLIKEVFEEINSMIKATKESIIGLQHTKKSYEILQSKSNSIVEKNKNVTKTLDEFILNVRRVKDIINGIYNISEETNLLALNASIESAKAKEQGRGLTVIATEIRELAEKTAELTYKINDITASLESNANNANSIINTVVQEISEENTIIINALEDYTMMFTIIDNLNVNIDEINDGAHTIVDYNNKIDEHINQLIHLSEHVNENTEEAFDLSESNLNLMEQSLEVLKLLQKVTEQLDKYIIE